MGKHERDDDETSSLLRSSPTSLQPHKQRTTGGDDASNPSPPPQSEEAAFTSKNVPKMFAYNFMDGAAFSIWQAQVLQVLLYQLDGNEAVGWVSGSAGGAQVCAALIAGYSADKMKKQVVCRAAALCGLVGVIVTLYAVHALYSPLFYMSGILWGVYMGLSNSSSEAIFADSIPSGRRATVYNWKWILQTLCWIVGYIMSLILFLVLGDKWEVSVMQTVLFIGLALHPIALMLLAWLKDEDSLKHDSAIVTTAAATSSIATKVAGMQARTRKGDAGQEDEAAATTDDSPAAADDKTTSEETTALDDVIAAEQAELSHINATGNATSIDALLFKLTSLLSWRTTPYFVCMGDFILAMGSGMTIRYIPLYFVNDYNVGPSLMMGVYLIVSFTTSFFSLAGKTLADRWLGRLPAIFLLRLVGTSLLLYLAVVPTGTPAAATGIVLAVFIVRNGCMNSTFGISRSVIMDCVPKETRGRWAAVESFASFTWAGSAALGGYLADEHGYKYTFLITAVLHFIGTSLLIPAWIGSRRLEAIVMQKSKERRDAKKKSKEGEEEVRPEAESNKEGGDGRQRSASSQRTPQHDNSKTTNAGGGGGTRIFSIQFNDDDDQKDEDGQ